jgi:regulator of protease activity HflC (stomatin/prohibitin superfamily)
VVVTEKVDMGLFFYFGTTKTPFGVIDSDYKSELRTFTSKRGKMPEGKGSDSVDYRAIFGVGTEITKDKEFQAGPEAALRNSCTLYGLEVANVSIKSVNPVGEAREKLTQEAFAEIDRRAKVTAAKATAESLDITSASEAGAIEKIGAAKKQAEGGLIKEGVTAAYRNAMAIESLPGLVYLSQGNGGAGVVVDPKPKTDQAK